MKKTVILVSAAILLLSTLAAAQFPKIKLPDLKTPKVPKVADQAKNSSGMSGGKNRQNVIDDGYTFFDATPVTERSEKYRGDIAKGWTLTSYLRAFGTYPDSSGFSVVVSKAGKTLAKFSCEAKVYRKADDYSPNAKNAPDDDYIMVNQGCTDRNKFVAGTGKFDVQVYSINGDNDEEKLLRTYKIDVHEAKKVRPGNIPGVSDFYIQRHAEATASILYLRPDKWKQC